MHHPSPKKEYDPGQKHEKTFKSPTDPTELVGSLASALPESIILPRETAAFKKFLNSYWAQQEREITPACVVRPRDVQQLCTAIMILKQEYKIHEDQANTSVFAIHSGGHSPVSGAASLEGGVVIDLNAFDEITVSENRSSVTIGAGAKWADVYKVLDTKGLAVAGGRDSIVGVSGLLLGGKYLLAKLCHFAVSNPSLTFGAVY